MQSLRIGLVGLGSVAEVHVAAYRGAPWVELVGCFDTDPERVTTFSRRHGIPGFRSLDEMLRVAGPAIVCVLTPAQTHESVVLACARARINILCEKPLALSVAACDRMIRACRDAEVKLCYGASYRYLPAIERAKELLDAGAIGEILVMREWALGGAGVSGRKTMGEGHYPKGGPGGSGMGLIDHGIHLIDLFAWLTGANVTRAVGRGNVAGAPQGPEYLLLEYANGAVGELVYEDGTFATELPGEGSFSWGSGWDVNGVVPPGRWQAHPGSIHVYGTAGSLRIFYYANILYLNGPDGLQQIKLAEHAAPAHFVMQLQAFAEALRRKAPPPVSAEAGREACRILFSVYPNLT